MTALPPTKDDGEGVSPEPDVAATLADSLDSLDDAINYRNWIVEMAHDFLEGPILELGAGHGTFTELLVELAPVAAVEPDAFAHQQLEDRFGGDQRVTISAGTIEGLPESTDFGSAVMINVLEHIADHEGVLEEVWKRLRPGGHLVIFVPAFQLLFSKFDKMLGHERRYRKPELETLVTAKGFGLEDSRYVNLPGFFSWFILVRLLRQVPTGTVTVKVFDRLIVPFVRLFEGRFRPPFGQSILLVAQKP